VLLDLDGTLISSFTPKRAPALPPSLRTHTVGVGTSINPAGVFVVERPRLAEFLAALAGFAEVAVFTAGEPSSGARARPSCGADIRVAVFPPPAPCATSKEGER
jgi:hypothetical protein